MSILARILAASIVAAFTVGPVSAATVSGASPVIVAQAASDAAGSASVQGTVKDDQGSPISGAAVTISGPQSYRGTTDAMGRFSISNIAPGLYRVTVAKAGYDTASAADFAVAVGQSQNLNVRMHVATFTSLRTIATVRSLGRGTFNTSTASVNVVTAQAFADQGEPQVTRVLNPMPGMQISFPASSASGAVPGAITVPDIRGAGSFETASLIDGHPLSVGQYGDYVTTFLNSYMLQSAEVIKGPGAMSPQVNYAIGGTVNFRTKDPTLDPTPDYTFGFTNHGGTFTNLGISDTVLAGRLGFVVDIASIDEPSAVNNYQAYFDPSGGLVNGQRLSGFNGQSTTTTVPGTASHIQTIYPLIGCCYNITGNYNSLSELLKFRYKLSSATSVTASYLGSQTTADQNGNTGNLTLGTFAPMAAYGGSLQPGALPVNYIHPGGNDKEVNNEPIVQAEVRSTIGRDTVLGRFYHAGIARLINEGISPKVPDIAYGVLSGTTCPKSGPNGTCAVTPVQYNGANVPISFYDYYNQTEEDKLDGVSFEWDHPIGNSNVLTFAIDQTNSQTTAYSISSFTSVSLPTGSSQRFTTALLRGRFDISPKLSSTLSLYENTYQSTYPVTCPFAYGYSNCAINGSNVTFNTSTNAHFDQRLGFEYRPKQDLALRASIGTAIAPPYLALLSQITPPGATYNTNTGLATLTHNNGGLRPETAFGFDFGADYRFKDHVTSLSGDIYQTNLFNHYFGQTVLSPYTCGSGPIPCSVSGGGTVPANTPIYYTEMTNLSNARFQGVELEVRRTPEVGLGYSLSAGLQRAYVYNLPPYFYCSQPVPHCTPNQNLNIIANQNFNGGSIGYGSTIGSMNTRVPYAQGNFEISYRTKNGAYAAFGDTYYGNNNSLNEPPFGIAYTTVRYPLSKVLSVQISGDNIFNAYSGLFPVYGGGVPVQLSTGAQGATVGNVLGPATYRFQITKTFGAAAGDFQTP
ncbi:MAG: TonB-dependent receptor domain-containing protein [Vulcanimicrobiaceae bacterium]